MPLTVPGFFIPKTLLVPGLCNSGSRPPDLVEKLQGFHLLGVAHLFYLITKEKW
jgi:hypothetical protein